ncbi:MAG: SCP-like extracellular [Massilibacillus sp.]|jgi:uncharacterized protein YkwD|nr:SCP-like extracellular [Massilibacillus sp.]
MNDKQVLKKLMVCFSILSWITIAVPGVTTNYVYAAAETKATTDEVQALSLLNHDRAKNGLAPLVYNAELNKLAETYADDMMKRGFFAHNNPEGLTPFDRMAKVGITYQYAGENLALNDTIEAAQLAFMNSPTHRENILNTHYTEVGIGVKYAPNGKVYVVQEFISK